MQDTVTDTIEEAVALGTCPPTLIRKTPKYGITHKSLSDIY